MSRAKQLIELSESIKIPTVVIHDGKVSVEHKSLYKKPELDSEILTRTKDGVRVVSMSEKIKRSKSAVKVSNDPVVKMKREISRKLSSKLR